MEGTENTAENKDKRRRTAFILLGCVMVAGIALLFWGLGDEAFLDYDEAAYSRVMEESAANGDLLSLRFIDDDWFDKPPLYFWLAFASSKLVGPIELAMRVPSAASGLLCVLLVWLIVRLLTKSVYAPAFAGAVLLTTGAYVDAARQVKLDTMVTAALVFSVYAFLKAFESPKWNVLTGAGIGVAVMTKSVVGLLAYPLIIAAAVSFRRYDWLKSKWFWAGQAVAFLTAFPWHAYQTATNGAVFWRSYLLVHVAERYSENLFGNDTGIMTYVAYLYRWAMPWALLSLCFALVFLIFRRKFGEYARTLAMPLVSAAFVFGLFSTAQTKVPYYLVPLYPFIAIFVALFMHAAWIAGEPGRRYVSRRVATAGLAVLLASASVSAIDRGFHLDDSLDVEHRISEDGKVIGLALKDIGPDIAVRFADPIYWEGVRFYSGGRRLGRLEDAAAGETYYLVAPSYKVRHSPEVRELAEDGSVLYAGEYLTLAKVTARR